MKNIVREFHAVTDDEGDFTYIFNPMPREAGGYTVTANHRALLGQNDPMAPDATDQFTIVGIDLTIPFGGVTVVTGTSVTVAAKLVNLGDVGTSGVNCLQILAPDGIDVEMPQFPDGLPADQVIEDLPVVITAETTAPASKSEIVVAAITADVGAVSTATVSLTVIERTPRLVMAPGE